MKRLLLYSTTFSFLYLSLFSMPSSGQGKIYKGWKAGVASVVITPDQPLWMAGYASRTHPSIGTLTDLHAKALALEDASGKQVVLVTMDLVGIPKGLSDHVRDELKSKYHLSRSQIILNTSHTHTGPVLTDALVDIYPVDSEEQHKIDRYTNKLGDKIVDVVGKALHHFAPVQLYSGNGVTRFQVNRRNNVEATLDRQTALNGPNDYAVPVIRVADNSGKLIAVVFGYACHNTVLSGYKWSGDYAGFAQLALEKAYPGATAMFFQGCGADQNPLPRHSVALAKQYGKELASAVETVLSENMHPLSPTLLTAYKEIALPLNPPPGKEELRKEIANSSGFHKKWATRLLNKINQGKSLRTTYPYPVETWKLGDQPIIILGGEVVVEYAIELKRIFGQRTFVMAYSNDVMSYIPTPRILREGGYEGAVAPVVYGLPTTWRADVETLIFSAVLQLAGETRISIPPTKVE
ncbi:MAG TPA: neutral/alkaline non-lysosomal ceramidase N-terminal domain-containing protein [Chitinophagaceae bacterium]|nr:neutral/alkaline non-lysosomal ceramidase N-terminal domain-containing protein [Chitinophagaceae bacterium]